MNYPLENVLRIHEKVMTVRIVGYSKPITVDCFGALNLQVLVVKNAQHIRVRSLERCRQLEIIEDINSHIPGLRFHSKFIQSKFITCQLSNTQPSVYNTSLQCISIFGEHQGRVDGQGFANLRWTRTMFLNNYRNCPFENMDCQQDDENQKFIRLNDRQEQFSLQQFLQLDPHKIQQLVFQKCSMMLSPSFDNLRIFICTNLTNQIFYLALPELQRIFIKQSQMYEIYLNCPKLEELNVTNNQYIFDVYKTKSQTYQIISQMVGRVIVVDSYEPESSGSDQKLLVIEESGNVTI